MTEYYELLRTYPKLRRPIRKDIGLLPLPPTNVIMYPTPPFPHDWQHADHQVATVFVSTPTNPFLVPTMEGDFLRDALVAPVILVTVCLQCLSENPSKTDGVFHVFMDLTSVDY